MSMSVDRSVPIPRSKRLWSRFILCRVYGLCLFLDSIIWYSGGQSFEIKGALFAHQNPHGIAGDSLPIQGTAKKRTQEHVTGSKSCPPNYDLYQVLVSETQSIGRWLVLPSIGLKKLRCRSKGTYAYGHISYSIRTIGTPHSPAWGSEETPAGTVLSGGGRTSPNFRVTTLDRSDKVLPRYVDFGRSRRWLSFVDRICCL